MNDTYEVVTSKVETKFRKTIEYNDLIQWLSQYNVPARATIKIKTNGSPGTYPSEHIVSPTSKIVIEWEDTKDYDWFLENSNPNA